MSADIYDRLLAAARKGCHCELRRKPCVYHSAFADGLEAMAGGLLAQSSCPHASASGVDSYHGPGKVWRCDLCGEDFRERALRMTRSVPTSALEGGDLCGRGGPDEPACTLVAGHDGGHEQWEG